VLVVSSPKFQERLLMLSVEVSVKVSVKGAVPDVGLAVKPRPGRSWRVRWSRSPRSRSCRILYAMVGEVILFAVLQAGEGVAGLIADIDVVSV